MLINTMYCILTALYGMVELKVVWILGVQAIWGEYCTH